LSVLSSGGSSSALVPVVVVPGPVDDVVSVLLLEDEPVEPVEPSVSPDEVEVEVEVCVVSVSPDEADPSSLAQAVNWSAAASAEIE